MMSEVPPPDWAALYQQHRNAMYRVAARVLRGAGRADEAGDAVSAAMASLLVAPTRASSVKTTITSITSGPSVAQVSAASSSGQYRARHRRAPRP